jgi:RNA recognition motif-containing protein
MSSNQTIYVQNLNEKIKLEDLRKMLYHLFSTCGPVLDINTRRSNKFRGQAWIVYDDLGAATKAVKQLNGASFCGKPLKLQFGRTKSHLIAKADGTYVAPAPKPASSDSAAGAAAAAPKSSLKRRADSALEPAGSKAARGVGASRSARGDGGSDDDDDADEEEEDVVLPSKTLFAQGLPPALTTHMVEKFFENASGYTAARIDAARPGVAFVEFDSVENATQAMKGLQGFKLSTQDSLKLSYAR